MEAPLGRTAGDKLRRRRVMLAVVIALSGMSAGALAVHEAGVLSLRRAMADPAVASWLAPRPLRQHFAPRDAFLMACARTYFDVLVPLLKAYEPIEGGLQGRLLPDPSQRWLDAALTVELGQVATAAQRSLAGVPSEESIPYSEQYGPTCLALLARIGMALGDPQCAALMNLLCDLAGADKNECSSIQHFTRNRAEALLLARSSGSLTAAWAQWCKTPPATNDLFHRVLYFEVLGLPRERDVLRTLGELPTPLEEGPLHLTFIGWLCGAWRAAHVLQRLHALGNGGWRSCPEQPASGWTEPATGPTAPILGRMLSLLGITSPSSTAVTGVSVGYDLRVAGHDALRAALQCEGRWRAFQAIDAIFQAHRRQVSVPATSNALEKLVQPQVWQALRPGTALSYTRWSPHDCSISVGPWTPWTPPPPDATYFPSGLKPYPAPCPALIQCNWVGDDLVWDS